MPNIKMLNINLSWIAVKGLDKVAVLDTLGLAEVPPDVEPFYPKQAVAELPSGWVIILAEDFMYPTPKRMAALSVGGMALACSIDERVMYSVARGYADGQAVWSVDHNGGEKGIYHLDVAGAPPPELAEARARRTALQDAEGGAEAEVDFVFEVPAETIEALCGYRFDSEREDGPTFTALEPVKKAKGGGWLAKLFGRR
jgi:hypothetical protein